MYIMYIVDVLLGDDQADKQHHHLGYFDLLALVNVTAVSMFVFVCLKGQPASTNIKSWCFFWHNMTP